MKAIIIQQKAYLVTNGEWRRLSIMVRKKDMQVGYANYKKWKELNQELSVYLTEKMESGAYKCLGYISFDFKI